MTYLILCKLDDVKKPGPYKVECPHRKDIRVITDLSETNPDWGVMCICLTGNVDCSCAEVIEIDPATSQTRECALVEDDD